MKTCSTHDLLIENDLRLLLLGFPKCGTTAFAEWFSTSPHVDVSSPKETCLLCPEFAGNLERSGLRDSELGDCFSKTPDMLRMEATTLNVYSSSLLAAAPQCPDLKCIILTRDPVEATLSWHNQVVNAGFPESEDFLESWNAGLSNESTEGQGFLQRYQEVSRHGYWSQKWIEQLGHERCLLVKASTLKNDPEVVRKRVERFLALDLELPAAPPVRNSYAAPRNRFIYDSIKGSKFLSMFRSAEQHLRFLATARRFVRDSILMKSAKKEIRSDIASTLQAAFADDQRLLAKLELENHSVWP